MLAWRPYEESGRRSASTRGAPVLSPSEKVLERTLDAFAPVTLVEMEDVALLQRMTTKMVLREDQLTEVLSQLGEDYDVLHIGQRRMHHYRTQYFDTPDYAFYYQHHNGQRERYKVRIRAYSDSGLAFLEVKRKTNQEMMIKERWPVTGVSTHIDAEGRAFLADTLPYPAVELAPTLSNRFYRVTLVSKYRAERLTLDIGVVLRVGQQEVALSGIAIAEIKRAAYSQRSEFLYQARNLGIRPVSFSKYCIGLSLLAPDLKANRFKHQHLLLARLTSREGGTWTIL